MAPLDTRNCRLKTWCVLEYGHIGACTEITRTSHQAPDFGPKPTTAPTAPKPQEVPVVVVWPEPGQLYADRVVPNRVLTIHEIRQQDSAGRNVIGRVRESGGDEHDYACDKQVFDTVWRRM